MRRGWTLILASGAVAAAAIWVAVDHLPESTSARTADYQTLAAQGGPIRLSSGVVARLDANSRMSLSQDGDAVDLKAGAAYFDVAHDPARSFVVRARGVEVRDVGTRFDVALSPSGEVAVGVAEGQVEVRPPGAQEAIAVAGGERLIVRPGAPAMRVTIDTEDVASWRSGSLRYRGAPLAMVAADISRYVGRPVVADARVAGLRFTGVIKIGDGTRLVENLEQLLPVTAETQGDVTRLLPHNGH